MSYASTGGSSSRLSTFEELSKRLQSHGLATPRRHTDPSKSCTELYRCLEQCIRRMKARQGTNVDSQVLQGTTSHSDTTQNASDTKQLHSALEEQANYNQAIRSRIQRNALYLQHLDQEILAKHGLSLPQSGVNQSGDASTAKSRVISLRHREQLLKKAIKQLTQVRDRLSPYDTVEQSESHQLDQKADENFDLPRNWKSATEELKKGKPINLEEARESRRDATPTRKRNSPSRSGLGEINNTDRPPKSARKSTLYAHGRKPPQRRTATRRRKLYK